MHYNLLLKIGRHFLHSVPFTSGSHFVIASYCLCLVQFIVVAAFVARVTTWKQALRCNNALQKWRATMIERKIVRVGERDN